MRIARRLIGVTGMRDIIERRIPVLTLDSKSPGPCVWLTACIHGDEAGGIVIVHDVFDAIRARGLIKGKLQAFPLINSLGFENVSRFINTDREDLNRCFPGDSRGSLGERIAHRLFDTIMRSEPDMVIDLHNDWVHSLPYILVEPASLYRNTRTRQQTLRCARATGLLMVEDDQTSPHLARTLSGALVAHGVPALTLEAGGSCGIVEESVAAGVAAVMAVLATLGMTEPAPAKAPADGSHELLTYTDQPRCTSSGLVRFAVAPGERIARDQTLARVYSAAGSCEESLRATAPGYVLGLADHARVVPGSEVIAIAQSSD